MRARWRRCAAAWTATTCSSSRGLQARLRAVHAVHSVIAASLWLSDAAPSGSFKHPRRSNSGTDSLLVSSSANTISQCTASVTRSSRHV